MDCNVRLDSMPVLCGISFGLFFDLCQFLATFAVEECRAEFLSVSRCKLLPEDDKFSAFYFYPACRG